MMAAPKTGTRGAFERRERPYRDEHERSTAARWERHPTRLRDLVRELHEAREAESGAIARLHGGGVEWDRVVIQRGGCWCEHTPVHSGCCHVAEGRLIHPAGGYEKDEKREPGGSKIGTPRWSVAFRAYVTGPDTETTEEGDWRWPLRSSLFRLSISRSGTDRLAAAFCWLLIHHRYNVREAWAAQCGVLADPAIADAAEAWAGEALRRWFARYVELPQGKPLA